ncbi:hypothetical protein [Burkholderia sp. Ac-20379]|uniref:hypothetical protein n=1 Tax=Burkholderia sp. Ac-20379 TaxID=2703900 RepID=UPI0019808EAC|nr:hypothetical protein [Burkholderia sp. Ac-20379]MBN3725359.1 hypothetical protein [Burkholderia sp. Ac-20379]
MLQPWIPGRARPAPSPPLNETARVDISVRNFLCLSVLETSRASAFHLGTIVRAAFVLAYLHRLGYATLTAKEFRRAERGFGRAAARLTGVAPGALDSDELQSARRVVRAFDLTLASVPVSVLATAHRHAQANFDVSLAQRMSMTRLVEDGGWAPA